LCFTVCTGTCVLQSVQVSGYLLKNITNFIFIKIDTIVDSVIGGDLKMICDRENNKIPKFVQKCVAAIESRGKFY
jgi:hypothetical protein